GATCVWLGLLLSYYANLPSGPCIVLLAGLAYALSVLFGPLNGLLRGQTALSPST
ncbi:MAG: metal ABC transporter permease, partial [Pseudomonas sp.]|uniref:metal ABC transporter permease n=1 Tax=Pseudomonas sp. TaxID=306 RepID=UPI003BB76F21